MSRKFKSYRSYNYNPNANIKKIILIALAVVLVVAAVIIAISLFGKEDTPTGTTAYMELLSSPDKTTYYVGESPSWFGLKARYVTSEGAVINIGPESCSFSGFDSSAPAKDQVITVTYRGFTDTFLVNILDPADQKPDPLFTGMTFKTLPKTQYKVGQWLSVEGGVLLKKYDDGSTEEMALNFDMVQNFTTAEPGTYTITVTYMEDGHRATLTYEITVTN